MHCACTMQIISFYFEFLSRDGGVGIDVLLLSGSTTFLLLHGSKSLASIQRCN